jgi:hypothetical protein
MQLISKSSGFFNALISLFRAVSSCKINTLRQDKAAPATPHATPHRRPATSSHPSARINTTKALHLVARASAMASNRERNAVSRKQTFTALTTAAARTTATYRSVVWLVEGIEQQGVCLRRARTTVACAAAAASCGFTQISATRGTSRSADAGRRKLQRAESIGLQQGNTGSSSVRPPHSYPLVTCSSLT